MKKYTHLLTLLVVALAIVGCKAPADIAYFQDVQESQAAKVQQVREMRCKPMDRLTILVKSKDYELASLFNLMSQTQSFTGGGNGGGSRYSLAYTVDSEGFIDMPVLGKVKVAGLSRAEIASYVKGLIIGSGQLLDPTVTVEWVNMQYSVLGEVRNPGTFSIDRDRLTLVEAISQAGDLQITGCRQNIRVIRQENGEERHYFVDLTDTKSLYESPAYYLQQDDIVYVEPNAKRKRESRPNGNTFNTASFWIGITSTVMSITSFVLAIKK